MNNRTGPHFLLRRIANGDSSAHAEFHDLASTPLTRFVAARYGSFLSGDDINEIVSQSILQIFLHAAEYRGRNGDSSAWRWAYEIVRNQTLKWLKIRESESSLQNGLGDGPDSEEQQIHFLISRFNPDLAPDSVEDQVIERMFRERALEIMQRLDGREKLILTLHFEQDWTFKQIANRLRVTPARIAQIMQGIRQKCLNAVA